MKPPRNAARTATLLALLLLAGTALAAKKVYNFQGGVRTRATEGLTREEIAPSPTQGGFFSWTYTFMFYLDDGSSGMVQFTYWKMYFKSQRGLYFSFSDPEGRTYLRKGVYDAGETAYTQDPPELRMGKNRWAGFYPEFRLHLDFPAEDGEPGMKGDLRFRCRTPGWRPGEGPVHYGEPDGDWYDLVVMIPWAAVTGTVTLNDKTRTVQGHGYSDHNTQDIFPTKQTEELMALRSFSEEHAVHFLEYIAPEDYGRQRTTWILVMKDDRILYATDKWEPELSGFRVWEKRGYRYPSGVTVRLDQPGCKLTGEIRSEGLVDVLDAIEEIPGFLRPLARRFVSAPVFMRQRVSADWRLQMPDQGIDDRFSAKGIFETTIVQ